jgi:hypothetical protein
MVGKVLLPYQLHGFDGFGSQRWVGLVSGRIIEKLKQIRSAKGLTKQRLEVCFLRRAIDQGGARIRRTSKQRITVITNAKIQYEVTTKVNFILSIGGKDSRLSAVAKILNEGLNVVITLVLLKVVDGMRPTNPG